MAQSSGSSKSKGLPKRVSRENWKARFKRYISDDRRAKHKAKRVLKNALRSKKDVRKIAIAQAEQSPRQEFSRGVDYYVDKLLKRLGL